MMDILERLPPGSLVLDLGARAGSFPTSRTDLRVVRLDLEAPPAGASGAYVRGDAARLPFRGGCFDAIVANHSLEHFADLENAVREIGRAATPGGMVYISVPDASTLTDRVYRWLGRGGGHVNAFRRPADVIGPMEKWTRLPHRSTTLLFSSLAFLNAHNFTARPPRKIALFAFGNERFLAWLVWVLRVLDRALGTRLSVYGWAFRFGGTPPESMPEAWINVCVRCGSGASEAYLLHAGAVRRVLGGMESYACPQCGCRNWLFHGGTRPGR
ncbi:MAG TPA: class I SAM-dependent methyltransferase [Bryobacteraceae bacterium]|nr:class I SAM-dependent methyltransferase [Bryobacteraceae bacterium]